MVDGETGFLVPIEQMKRVHLSRSTPEKFERELAARINQLMADEELQVRFGKAGRRRAEEKFSWQAIARETEQLYESLVPAS